MTCGTSQLVQNHFSLFFLHIFARTMDFAALLRQAREEAAKGQTRGNKDRAAACAPALASLRNAEEGRRLGCRVVELLPGTCWYCADFVSAEEADALEVEVRKQSWEQLSGRKLQNWGGVPHPSGTILEPMPTFVDALATRLHASGVFADEKPNQALVNLYGADEGIAPHQDGPTFKPRAAILSLGQSPAVLAFRDPKESSTAKVLARIVMEPRSLVVFAGQAYLEWEHWVPAAQEQSIEGALNASLLSVAGAQDGVTIKKSERISLTMRCVANVKTSVDEDDLALDPEMRREVARRHEWWRRAISQ